MTHMDVAKFASININSDKTTSVDPFLSVKTIKDLANYKQPFFAHRRKLSKKIVFKQQREVNSEQLLVTEAKTHFSNKDLIDKLNYFYKPYDNRGMMNYPTTMKFDEIDYNDLPHAQVDKIHAQQAKNDWKKLSNNILKTISNNKVDNHYLKEEDSPAYISYASPRKRIKSANRTYRRPSPREGFYDGRLTNHRFEGKHTCFDPDPKSLTASRAF